MLGGPSGPDGEVALDWVLALLMLAYNLGHGPLLSLAFLTCYMGMITPASQDSEWIT